MDKIKTFARFAIVALLFLAVSCEKILDNLPGKPKNCRIKRIHFFENTFDYYGDFYYNKWGNPDSVIFGFVATGYTNLLLKYNNRKQLTQAKFTYTNPLVPYESWHKFGYVNGSITTDTVYIWGSNEEPEPLSYYAKRIDRYEYDNSGRIIKQILDQVYPDYPPTELIYSYDSNGNLITQRGLVYDNYTNIHVLHPIWQFLDRDYNLNNPIEAISYNNFRLPLNFDQQRPSGELAKYTLFGRSLDKSVIEYDCK
jgi:hypothetical protein